MADESMAHGAAPCMAYKLGNIEISEKKKRVYHLRIIISEKKKHVEDLGHDVRHGYK